MADVSSRLERFMAGELSRGEEREIAQAALQDGELFDALMTASTTHAALRLEGAGERAAVPVTAVGNRAVRFLRTPVGRGVLAAAAAAIIVVVVSPIARRTAAPSTPSAPAPASQPLRPIAPSAPDLPAPTFLTAHLEDLAGTATAAFRAAPSPSRPPNAEGAITSVREHEAWAALGSVDGVTQGAVLQIFRGRDRTNSIGSITANAVFRDRMRGSTTTASPRPGDVAVLPPRLVVAALHQRMVSLIAAGEIAAARATGDRAAALLQAPDVPVSDKRGVLALLGALERRSGSVDRAVEHLRAAAALFDGPARTAAGERTDTLTELAAALAEAHQGEAASQALRLAQTTASGAAAGRIENNLGAVAAMRGDREAAAALYQSALRSLGRTPATADERRAIEKNLADLTAVR
jgi:hypothetical protein